MKNVKFLLSAACTLFAVAAMAQQDFSGPQYAKWGDTPEEREKNILNSNFLKESYDNRDYDAAARYLRDLLNSCPDASVAIYQRGANVYKQKINRAKNVTEKNAYIDSLMQIYDLRAKYFGDNAKQGLAFILDQKAREYLAYKPNDRAGIRKAFREALEAGGDNADPETVVAYFSNLCDDYKNTDEVMPDEVIAEYDRLSQFFEKHPEAAEMKGQFDTAFGVSGAASCENLEKLFGAKLAAAPDDRGAARAGRGADVARRLQQRFLPGDGREVLCGEAVVQYGAVAGPGFPEQARLCEGHDLPERGAGRGEG